MQSGSRQFDSHEVHKQIFLFAMDKSSRDAKFWQRSPKREPGEFNGCLPSLGTEIPSNFQSRVFFVYLPREGRQPLDSSWARIALSVHDLPKRSWPTAATQLAQNETNVRYIYYNFYPLGQTWCSGGRGFKSRTGCKFRLCQCLCQNVFMPIISLQKRLQKD